MQYLLALEDALLNRRPVSDEALSTALKMSRTTLWEWKHDPNFKKWLRAELDQTSDEHWPLILRRHELLAIQGSVKSAEFIGKVKFIGSKGGGFTPENEGGDVTNMFTNVNVLVQQTAEGCVPLQPGINLLVPRPPALEGQTS